MDSVTSCKLHPNMELIVVCSLETCQQRSIGCVYCLQEFHSDHPDSCTYLEDLIGDQNQKENLQSSNYNIPEIDQISQAFDQLSDNLTSDIKWIESKLQKEVSKQQKTQNQQLINLEIQVNKCYSLKIVGELFQQFKNDEITADEFSEKISQFLDDKDRQQQIAEAKQMLRQLKGSLLELDEDEVTLTKADISSLCQTLPDVFQLGDQSSFLRTHSVMHSQNCVLQNSNKRLLSSFRDSTTYVYSAFKLTKGSNQWKVRLNKVDPVSMGLVFGVIEETYKLQHHNVFRQGTSIYWNVFNNSRTSYSTVTSKVLGPIFKSKTEPTEFIFNLDFEKNSFKIDCLSESSQYDFTKSNIAATHKEAGAQFVEMYFQSGKTFRFFVYCQSATIDLELV